MFMSRQQIQRLPGPQGRDDGLEAIVAAKQPRLAEALPTGQNPGIDCLVHLAGVDSGEAARQLLRQGRPTGIQPEKNAEQKSP